MEMSSFNSPYMMNSSDTSADGFFHLKPSVSECFSAFPNGKFMSHGSLSERLQDTTDNWNSGAEANDRKPTRGDSSSLLISFGSPSSARQMCSDKLQEDLACNMDTRTTTRNPMQAWYHVMAEKRRRQKLTQLFIDLSKVLPGLKKLDKASLLGEAISYMKKLKERVTLLEEKANKSRSAVNPAENAFSRGEDQSCNGRPTNPIHDIKVRISCPTLLIKLLCDKHDSLVSRILGQIGKLHLIVSDISVIPFGCSSLDITILAEMGSGFCWTEKDVRKQLEMVILNPQDMQNTYFDSEDFSNVSPISELEF